MAEDTLKTIPELAREFGVTERRADYAAKQAGIEPTRRIGIIRLFDRRAAKQIKESMEAIESKRGTANV